MAELVPGLYERLITAGLDEQLRGVEADLIERSRLDPADADVEAGDVGEVVVLALEVAGAGELVDAVAGAVDHHLRVGAFFTARDREPGERHEGTTYVEPARPTGGRRARRSPAEN